VNHEAVRAVVSFINITAEQTRPGYGREQMKSMVLLVVALFMFLTVDAAYGLGGGGHGGDGRADFSQSNGNGGGSTTNSSAQGAPSVSNGTTGGTGAADNGFVMTASTLVVSVPEPMVVTLLGLGIVGLAGLRRKFRV
jgi:hypothetical protein